MRRWSRREILIVGAGAALLILLGGFQWILSPALEKRDRLERQVLDRTAALETLISEQAKARRFLQEQSRGDGEARSRKKGFTLFSFLDQLAVRSNIKDNIVHMKPDTRTVSGGGYTVSMVTVKMEDLYLKGLLSFLAGIESAGKGVHVTGLSLSKTGKGDLLDALVEARTVMLKEGP